MEKVSEDTRKKVKSLKPSGKVLSVTISFVCRKDMKGRASTIKISSERDMSVKDILGYLLL